MSISATQPQQEPGTQDDGPVCASPASHGCTGEGSGSAMARLISQEQARQAVPAYDDGLADPS